MRASLVVTGNKEGGNCGNQRAERAYNYRAEPNNNGGGMQPMGRVKHARPESPPACFSTLLPSRASILESRLPRRERRLHRGGHEQDRIFGRWGQKLCQRAELDREGQSAEP